MARRYFFMCMHRFGFWFWWQFGNRHVMHGRIEKSFHDVTVLPWLLFTLVPERLRLTHAISHT
jgi:hypothetical protein